ncbi:MAG: type II 3-dehydroquinate dehydratase [Saprospiraceae bacterium]|nr:type II 3-dehydroquinate dehydratase [Saprospiraceae bacterium]
MKILILNGPNLNLLGKREPHIYGSATFEDYLDILRKNYPSVSIEYLQSNHEGVLIDKLHEVGFDNDYLGIVFNAGGLTHTSVAIGDAIAGIQVPVVEVHISNVHARESFRHHSYLSAKAAGIIVGMGLMGYKLAVEFLLTKH